MKAHELISDPRKFTTGTLARDRQGKPVSTLQNSGAVRFDPLGAIFWCYPDGAHLVADPVTGLRPGQKALMVCRSKHGHGMLGRLNWREALEVLQEADV